MTLAQQSYILENERQRLDGELDDLADQLANADDIPPTLQQRASNLESQYQAVCHLIDKHGRDAEVAVGALTAGEMARVDKFTPGDGGPRARKNVYAGLALIDAPFLDRDALAETAGPDEKAAAKVDAVTSTHPGVPLWIEDRADEVGQPGNSRPLQERIADRSDS